MSYNLLQISLFGADGQNKSFFHPFSGVTEELKAFLRDVSEAKVIFIIGSFPCNFYCGFFILFD